jgi:hypothetical protein
LQLLEHFRPLPVRAGKFVEKAVPLEKRRRRERILSPGTLHLAGAVE